MSNRYLTVYDKNGAPLVMWELGTVYPDVFYHYYPAGPRDEWPPHVFDTLVPNVGDTFTWEFGEFPNGVFIKLEHRVEGSGEHRHNFSIKTQMGETVVGMGMPRNEYAFFGWYTGSDGRVKICFLHGHDTYYYCTPETSAATGSSWKQLDLQDLLGTTPEEGGQGPETPPGPSGGRQVDKKSFLAGLAAGWKLGQRGR